MSTPTTPPAPAPARARGVPWWVGALIIAAVSLFAYGLTHSPQWRSQVDPQPTPTPSPSASTSR